MKISIIIPTIGRNTLENVLKNICNCDNFDIIKPEIIVVFDGEKKVLNFKHDYIKTFATKNKVYASGARNLGLSNANGDIIVFIGDDTSPDKKWLQKIYDFHKKNTKKESGLLGKISWTKELAQDDFHKWLENNAQFDFKNLLTKKPTWHHFYTSNISVKKELIGYERFSNKFIGWGFEDTEFGYRLAKKKLELTFDPTCEIFHNHKQYPEKVWEQTKNARKNALIFENLHPEIKIIPRGIKKYILYIFIILITPLSYISNNILWKRQWKKNWLQKD